MPGPFQGISIANSALRTFQRAMENTGNNIANVNTPGFSRQRLDLRALEPYAVNQNGTHLFGSGVGINGLVRIRDMFLQGRMQASLSDQGQASTLRGNLTRIESVYNEPGDSGIANSLDKFYNAWSALASNPSNQTAKAQVREAAQNMTAKVRSTHAALADNYADARGRAESMLTSMKDITERIAALNTEIKSLQVTGGAAGSLQDQRDMLIEDLSKITEITTSNQANGTIDIFAGNVVLVDSAGARDFPTTINYSTLSLTDGTTNFPVKGGALLGQIQSVNRIGLAMQDLDNMANTMRTQINTLHQSGVNSAGVGGVRFFNDVPDVIPPTLPLPQTGAGDFDLDPAILADAQAIAAGTTTAAGDGALALQISNSRTQKLSALGNRSITEFYRGHIDAIGREVAYQEAQLETFDAIVQQTSNQIQEQSGVSLDEEMADMMKFQRSYQAAARVLTIMDQNAEDIINMIRR